MSRRKPAREVREKMAAASYAELPALERQFRREIPAAQSVHSAVRQEMKRRRRAGIADA